ncbi:MAG TPA: lasso peptide biosynthesis B2 protein [Natronosporangium sp.]
MSGPVAMPARGRVPWRQRPAVWLAVGLARVLAAQPPHRLRWLLRQLRRGARPATVEQARAARAAVVATSPLCAGEGCLPRSIATAVLCRLRGNWPTWCTGVRTAPFAAHAWVEVAGEPVDEPYPAGYFRPTVTVPPAGAGD